MIETRIGNMLAHAQEATNITPGVIKAYAHGTNCQGRMGSGIALTIKHMFPEVYNTYVRQYKYEGLQLGNTSMVQPAGHDHFLFFNCNTQDKYRGFRNADGTVEPHGKVYVDYDGVKKCFEQINEQMLSRLGETPIFGKSEQKITELEVHFPLIGAGLANGDWGRIEAIIDEALDDRITKVLWKLEK